MDKAGKRIEVLLAWRDLVVAGGDPAPAVADMMRIGASGEVYSEGVDRASVTPWQATISHLLRQLQFGVADPLSQLPDELMRPRATEPVAVVLVPSHASPRLRLPVPRPGTVPADVGTLAALLSPASRVEPELLRAVRLECLPELPVDAEQELWFSPLVDARSDGGITFAPEEVRELRARLRGLYAGDGRALVERAREVLDEVHAGISPLLKLEEELAWHEVVGDAAGAVAAADVAVRAVAARRDGAVHWVERVWSTLPQSVRGTPAGWVLGHVAGARTDLPDTPGRLADHHLGALLATTETTRLGISRAGGLLRLGVPLDEAQATIDLPDTRPRVVEIDENPPRRVLVGNDEIVEVPVGDRPIGLRTLAGDVYLFGDDRRELLDSVLLGPNVTWCVTRIVASRVVFGHVGRLADARPVFPGSFRRVNVGKLVGRVGREGGGESLIAFDLEHLGLSLAEMQEQVGVDLDGLPVRERRPLGPDTVVRTLARGPTGVDVVTLRATDVIATGLVGLDATGVDLVVGAPLVDDADRLVGVVAPASWADAAAGVSVELLERVGAERPAMSRQLLHVQAGYANNDVFELRDADMARMAEGAESLWLAGRNPDGSGSLLCRYGAVEVTSILGFRRRVRATQPEPLPPHDATALLDTLDANASTVTMQLDEDQARLVEAFVAGLERPAELVGGFLRDTGGAPAARIGDPTGHPGIVGPPGLPNVLIGGMPAATVATALHTCMMPRPAGPHPPSAFVPGSPTVLIGGSPALRMGDMSGCGAPILIGAFTVLIG